MPSALCLAMGAMQDLRHLVRTYWSVLLGHAMEWYEFAVYAYLAVYLEKKFFHGSAVGVWLGFGTAFLARPFGGLLLGVISDRCGRKVAINLSIVGMLVGTCGQGCLPTFSQPGAGATLSLACLVVCRLLQGLSVSGEIATLSTYIAEVAPKEVISRSMSLITINYHLGTLAAKGTIYFVDRIFGEEAFESWAWRLPFLIAAIPGLIVLWGRRGLPESEKFNESKVAKPKSESTIDHLCTVCRKFWPGILIGGTVNCAMCVVANGPLLWGQSFLQVAGMTANDRMAVDLLSRFVAVATTVLLAWLGDKVGILWIMICGAVATALAGLPLWTAVEQQPTDLTTVALAIGLGFGMLSALNMTVAYQFFAELFPTEVRTTAVGIGFNVGTAIYGGLTPVLCQASLRRVPWGPGLLFSLSGMFTLAWLVAGLWLQRMGVLKLAHIRPELYCIVRKKAGEASSVTGAVKDAPNLSCTDSVCSTASPSEAADP